MPDTTIPLDPTDVARDVRTVFARLRRRMRAVAASDALSPSQAAVLTRLGKGEAATASALATLEHVRPQSMAATVAALEERGLVTRAADPDDGRRQLLRLTPAGREAFDGDVAARAEWLAETLRANLDQAELRTLAEAFALLERITQ
ncbi:MarR family winged helix-turn-helix transcriptional regulator [Xylanimonas ulmi]|uniref:DNA-binding MarR family transcriptional regulator n=1 Tax=Xylanimonas ulmi TaxID=228973 RepID=A0A4Q7M660_9MICO|nr:MarR family transcriptional regulator [Xylanibacterium ulmi]RZS62553.1 DNA-binding MarR family transcriptional regulator [Xylanibacterium ulmi]